MCSHGFVASYVYVSQIALKLQHIFCSMTITNIVYVELYGHSQSQKVYKFIPKSWFNLKGFDEKLVHSRNAATIEYIFTELEEIHHHQLNSFQQKATMMCYSKTEMGEMTKMWKYQTKVKEK